MKLCLLHYGKATDENENRVLERLFGPKREEVTRDCRNVFSGEPATSR